jgi:predicted Zn-dependent protease
MSHRAATLALAVSLLTCARNPVTGRPQLALISEDQEIALGKQAGAEVARSVGLVEDKELQQYVARIGARLAKDSERPELPWTFRVVDDAAVNAFALPGGQIFVTRGLLAHLGSEAELAVVLGHEIGHVTARHSVSQISKAQLGQLALGVGAVLVPEARDFLPLASTGLQLLFLKYGRDAERQADELGFEYVLRHGYDARAGVDVFAALARTGGDEAGRLPGWLLTHPRPEERIESFEELAQERDVRWATLERNRPTYMAALDDLPYGDNPRHGYFQGTTFIHPDGRFRISFPRGFETANQPSAVVAVAPSGGLALVFTIAPQDSPEAAAQQFASAENVRATRPARERLGEREAVTMTFLAQLQGGTAFGATAFFRHGGVVYQVLGIGAREHERQIPRLAAALAESFAEVTDPAILNIQPPRIDIVEVERPTTLAEVHSSMKSPVPLDTLVKLNGIPAKKTLEAGALLKRVVGTKPG